MTEEESRLYEKAVRLAASAHKGQVDKGGTDYIRHPLAVASMLEDGRDRIAAVLHDVVEDTKVTLEELAREFPPDIVEAVRLLTRQPGPPGGDPEKFHGPPGEDGGSGPQHGSWPDFTPGA